MCCEADWKREVVPDHKFDFINIREFHQANFSTRLKYVFRYIFLLKSVAVYALDIFTAVTMISSDHWTNSITSKCDDEDDCAIDVQFNIAKWVFVGCIIFSFLLLGYETYKAKRVVDSRDISYGFTNLLANDYYSFRNYDNFCLFCQIESSTKKKDSFAFFVFFTFKGWKRLLLADGPRQSINGLLLYSFAAANDFQTSDIPAYWDNSAVTAMLLFSMILTVLIFAGSLIMLIIAGIFYMPLLCYIQGNLKEYVCHKVDKRISELIKKKTKQRIARAAAIEKKRMAAGGNRSSQVNMGGGMPQPTLPQVSLDEDEDMMMTSKLRGEDSAMSAFQSNGYSKDVPGLEYPPAADYGGVYQPGTMPYEADYQDYGSSTNLTANAGPMGVSYPPALITQPSIPSYSSSIFPSPYPALAPTASNPAQPSFPPSRSQGSLNLYDHAPAGRVSPSFSGNHVQQGYNEFHRDRNSGGSGGTMGVVYNSAGVPHQQLGGIPRSQSPYGGYDDTWR